MVNIYSLKGKVVGKTELPKVFKTDFRPDVIQKAVVFLQSSKRQPYSNKENAGMFTSADYFGRRKGAYRMTINKGMSRLPREKSGGGGLGRVRLVPNSVGGRRSHPPKNKDWTKKMNNKEYMLAIKSAIAATQNKELLTERGHDIEGLLEVPLVVEDSFEKILKTKEVIEALTALGLANDLSRASEKSIRAGRGKTRGRKYKKKKTALIVIKEDSGLVKSAGNIPGIDVVALEDLDIELLAPGTHAGRLIIWTKGALENLDSIVGE
ncbi:MAG: 50S ribosomal protein L4 [Candidatus Altiarchaeia archaeon]